MSNGLFDDFPDPENQVDSAPDTQSPPLPLSGHAKPTDPVVFTSLNYSPQIVEACKSLFYRNSMLDDYRTCPQLAFYKWLMGLEEEDTWVAGLAGTAGHSCIEEIHSTKQFNLTYLELSKLWLHHFDAACKSSSVPPRVSTQYSSLKAQASAMAHEYAEMLEGYSIDQQNRTFNVTMAEQSFVLQLKDQFNRDFIFTGTIDQAGVYENGVFALRDIKFRANNFKPSQVELKLNTQLTLYAYALRNGVPSCYACAPKYNQEGGLTYNGPCLDCKSKIGTAAWPQLYVERSEIIWMRDYTARKSNEYAQYVVSDTEKELNPKTGRQVKKKTLNPKFLTGYKKGDRCGSGHLVSDRTQEFLQVHIRDLLMQAGMMRDGLFYRKPGQQCVFWCKYKKQCVEHFETEVEDVDVVQIGQNIMNIDPFSD